jgi:hypothetical protein
MRLKVDTKGYRIPIDIAVADVRPQADKRWFSVWFQRVYAKRDGKWTYLSHRTVHGPTFGGDRQSVRDK